MQQNPDREYYVTVIANNKTIKVNRIFVKIEGGSFWLPNAKYREIEGTDQSSSEPIIERI